MSQETSSVAVQGNFGRVAVYSTNRALVEHAHQEFNFIFHTGGAASGFVVGQHEYTLNPSTAILVNPWLPHAKLASEGDAITNVLAVLPDTAWLAQTLDCSGIPLLRLFERPDVHVGESLQRCVLRIASAMQGGAVFMDSQYEPLVQELVLELARHYVDPSVLSSVQRATRPMDARIMKSLGLIRSRVKENPNLETIASDVGLSRSRFFEQFKACVGVTPQQYLDWARMAVATELLARGEENLAEISDTLGFSAPSHFARFFAQHMGVSPSEYRRGIIVET